MPSRNEHLKVRQEYDGNESLGMIICWQIEGTEDIHFLSGKTQIKIPFPTLNSSGIASESYSL